MLQTITAYWIVLGCSGVGILYGLLNYLRVKKVELRALANDGDYTPLGEDHKNSELDSKQVEAMLQIGDLIANVILNNCFL